MRKVFGKEREVCTLARSILRQCVGLAVKLDLKESRIHITTRANYAAQESWLVVVLGKNNQL